MQQILFKLVLWHRGKYIDDKINIFKNNSWYLESVKSEFIEFKDICFHICIFRVSLSWIYLG